MIKSVQVSRGLAAIAVAIYHVSLLSSQKSGVVTFGEIAQYGYLGVPYFFVLSGFIIAHAHWSDLGKPEKLPGFAWRRFSRLYPVYWVFSLGFLAAAFLGIGDADIDPHPAAILENTMLVHFRPEFMSPPLKVAWTLFYEVRFYALFAIAILNRPLGIGIAVAWAAACLTLTPLNRYTYQLLSYWSFAFFFGVAAAVAYRKLNPRHWPAFAVAGLILCCSIFAGGALVLKNQHSWQIFPISAGFGCIVLSLAMLEKARPISVSALAVLLGNASYSIYLVHSAVISVVLVLIAKLHINNLVPHWLSFFPILITAIAAGVVAHLVVEKPLLAAMKRIRSRFEPGNAAQPA